MDEIYVNVRRNIAYVRERRSYSQSQLARALQIPQSTYAGYESGIRKFPLGLIKRIAVFFGVTIDCLCDDKAPYIDGD